MKKCDKCLQVVPIGFVIGLCIKSLSSRSKLWIHVNDWSKWSGCFFPRHMGDDLVFGLITTKCLEVSLGLGCVHSARCRSRAFVSGEL
jgi:hypothetical protein